MPLTALLYDHAHDSVAPMKAAIITGAGSGIGRSTALLFAKNDFHVFLLGRDLQKLRATQMDCGERATPIVCDLFQQDHIESAVQQILSSGHSVEVLVNNAGTYVAKPLLETTEQEWIDQFQIHVMGAVRLITSLWPHFVKNHKGSIINVSSTLGMRPAANTSAYSAMKAAQINLTQTLALEGAPHKIRVNAVSPGIVDTPIHASGSVEKMHQAQPLGRVGHPEDIARAVFFLATDSSAWTTGAVLPVDGGINLL